MLFEAFEQEALASTKIDLADKLSALNKHFDTSVKPYDGLYGTTRVDKGFGASEVTGKNELGHFFRDYLQDDKLYLRRIHLGNHQIKTQYFDDFGTCYLSSVPKVTEGVKGLEMTLTPNTTIVKGNYTAVTDAFGRPVLNKIEDLQLRPQGAPRKPLSKNLYDESYVPKGDGTYTYERGHLTPDSFGGPATKDNIVPQLSDVNRKQFAEVERIARSLKEDGHTVDYEVRTNYSDLKAKTQPSSFEHRITVDGKKHELPDHLKKIYNTDDPTLSHKVFTTAKERLGAGHELGVNNGLLAAAITLPVATMDGVSSYLDGKITLEEMVIGIASETTAAGAFGYGTTFITVNISQAMSASSSALISRIGGSCAPAAVVSFAVTSYEDASSYARGEIEAEELALNLGENAAGVAGAFAGGACAGAALGAVAGPAGSFVGSIVGGAAGCALATEAYSSAVEMGSEHIEALSTQVDQCITSTMDAVVETAPEHLEEIRQAFNDYFAENDLHFKA